MDIVSPERSAESGVTRGAIAKQARRPKNAPGGYSQNPRSEWKQQSIGRMCSPERKWRWRISAEAEKSRHQHRVIRERDRADEGVMPSCSRAEVHHSTR